MILLGGVSGCRFPCQYFNYILSPLPACKETSADSLVEAPLLVTLFLLLPLKSSLRLYPSPSSLDLMPVRVPLVVFFGTLSGLYLDIGFLLPGKGCFQPSFYPNTFSAPFLSPLILGPYSVSVSMHAVVWGSLNCPRLRRCFLPAVPIGWPP